MGQLAPWILVHAGLIDVDGPFPRGGAFDRGGTKDGIDFPILDGMPLLLRDLRGALLYIGLRGLSGVEDKLLEPRFTSSWSCLWRER